jgi:general secretion pathway protein E
VTFADGLRSILRQDPDVIMVGEIRDGDTAEIAVRAALTGHLVFSTLHTNNAITAPGRLMDMGVEPFLLSSVLEGILAQRLGRRVCGACKEQVSIAEAVKHRLSRAELEMFGGRCWMGRGCDKCNNQGMRGRLGFYEVLLTTPGMRQCMARRASALDMGKHVQPGFITMRRDGVRKAVSGMTSIEEVLRATQDAEDAAEVAADAPTTGGPAHGGMK